MTIEETMMKRRWTKWLYRALVATALASVGLGAAYLVIPWGLRSSDRQGTYRLDQTWTAAGDRTFRQPFAIAVDPRNGHVFVTDAANQRVVIFSGEGEFIRQFGSEGDGPGEFQRPTGIAVGPAGSIYVADYMQDRIQKFTAKGEFLRQWGSTGSGNEQFRSPNGLAVDKKGRVYVADFMNKVVKVFSPKGEFVHTVGQPGQWQLGDLDYPTDVDVGPNGQIFVADAYNYRIQRYTPSGDPQVAWGWHLLWLWPRPNGGSKGFNIPTGVAVGPKERVHVADSSNNRIVMLGKQGAYITDWTLPDPASENGSGYHTPNMVAVGPKEKWVYATDIANNRVIVLEVSASD